MSLFSLIAVLLLEQIRPLPYPTVVHRPLLSLARILENVFNAGERGHGVIAWCFGVGGLVLAGGAIYAGLHAVSPILGWLWNVLVLYFTMGFRQFSHHFSEIEVALRVNDLAQARALLARWRARPASDLSASEVARLAIEEALKASHRHVFGVLVCFVVLPGPCGAILYRAAAFFADLWRAGGDADTERFGTFSRQAFALIDWLPARITASGFAIVGNFEDAIYCWRTQAAKSSDQSPGNAVVLASAAGALGVRLGMPLYEAGQITDRAEIGTGQDADVDFMQSAAALVWRALVLWLLLLLLLGLAGLVGG